MELKEIAIKLFELFNVQDKSLFTESVRKILFSQESEKMFDRYLELLPTLS